MTQARPRKADTRQRILTAAGKLFRAEGVDGVGVDAVMRAAGLTHGGFYAHFRSKDALVAEVCGTLLGRSAERWEHVADTADAPAALGEIVRGYLDPAWLRAGHPCPLATIGPDVARRDESRGTMGGALRRMIGVLTRLLAAGRTAGVGEAFMVGGREAAIPVVAEASARERALVSLSTMVGAVVLSRLADDPELAGEILASAKREVLGI